MSRRVVLLWIAMVVCLVDVALGWAACFTFVPADARDTDTAGLIDNVKVEINGTPVNSNFNFEAGTLAGFSTQGDVRVIECLGAIVPPDGSKFFMLQTTGPGARTDFPFYDTSHLTQNFSATTVTQATVSLDLNILTNENANGKRHRDSIGLHLQVGTPTSCCTFLGVVFDRNVRNLALTPAPPGTGFQWQTGFNSITVDITAQLQDAINRGCSRFNVYPYLTEPVVPLLEIVLNKTSFRTGEELIVSAKVTSEAKPVNTEVRVWARLPSGPSVPLLTLHTQPIAARTNVMAELLRYRFSGIEASGFYAVNARMFETGQLEFIDDEFSKGFNFSP